MFLEKIRRTLGSRKNSKKKEDARSIERPTQRWTKRYYKERPPEKYPLFPWKRIEKEEMPPLSRMMFKRMAKILHMPISELSPTYVGQFSTRNEGGRYYDKIHGISIKYYGDAEILNHELFHAATFLLFPRQDSKAHRAFNLLPQAEAKLNRDFIESLAEPEVLSPIGQSKIYDRLLEKRKKAKDKAKRTKLGIASAAIPVSLYAPEAGAALGALGLFIDKGIQALINRRARQRSSFFSRHGVDGIILVATVPPKKFDLEFVRRYERWMVLKGILKRKGGLTKKGEQLIQRALPKEKLQELRARQEMPNKHDFIEDYRKRYREDQAETR